MSLKFVWKLVFIKSFHTKIDIEGVCDGVCFLYKNDCFSRFIKLILIQTIKKNFKNQQFCLKWGFTELNLRTISIKIYFTAILFSITDILNYQEGFHLFVFDASWRNRCILEQCSGIS